MEICDPYNTKTGDEIIFAAEGGYPFEVAQAQDRLTLGERYIVSDIEDKGWETRIWLEGYSGYFNSVLFSKPVEENAK